MVIMVFLSMSYCNDVVFGLLVQESRAFEIDRLAISLSHCAIGIMAEDINMLQMFCLQYSGLEKTANISVGDRQRISNYPNLGCLRQCRIRSPPCGLNLMRENLVPSRQDNRFRSYATVELGIRDCVVLRESGTRATELERWTFFCIEHH